MTRDEQVEVGGLRRTGCTESVSDHLCQGTEEEDREETSPDLFSMANSIEKTDRKGDAKGDAHDDGRRLIWVITVVVPGAYRPSAGVPRDTTSIRVGKVGAWKESRDHLD